jgi:hypothetical protein
MKCIDAPRAAIALAVEQRRRSGIRISKVRKVEVGDEEIKDRSSETKRKPVGLNVNNRG